MSSNEFHEFNASDEKQKPLARPRLEFSNTSGYSRVDLFLPQPEQRQSRTKQLLGAIGMGKRDKSKLTIDFQPDLSFCIKRFNHAFDLTQINNPQPEDYGYMFPEMYDDKIDAQEADFRLQQLATWLNPKLPANVSGLYSAIHELEGEHQQICNIKSTQIEAAREENRKKPEHERVEGLFVGMIHSVELSKASIRYGQKIEAVGINENHFRFTYALSKIDAPEKFIMSCESEFLLAQNYSDTIDTLDENMNKTRQAIATIGDSPILQNELRNYEETRSAIERSIRMQTIRICYMAMNYDRGKQLPVPGFESNPGTSERSDVWHESIAMIHSCIREDMPEELIALARKLSSAIAFVPVVSSDDSLNAEIATYFASAVPISTTDTYIQALEEQLKSRFGHYLITL